MYRKVTSYKTVDGKCPVAEFIDNQPVKVAQKIAWVLKSVHELEKQRPKTLTETVLKNVAEVGIAGVALSFFI